MHAGGRQREEHRGRWRQQQRDLAAVEARWWAATRVRNKQRVRWRQQQREQAVMEVRRQAATRGNTIRTQYTKSMQVRPLLLLPNSVYKEQICTVSV